MFYYMKYHINTLPPSIVRVGEIHQIPIVSYVCGHGEARQVPILYGNVLAPLPTSPSLGDAMNLIVKLLVPDADIQ